MKTIIIILILWLLPPILIFLLLRKHNKIVKKHNLKDFELITAEDLDKTLLIFFFTPVLNIIVYFLILKDFFSKDGIGRKYVSFFGIKSINGKTFSIKKFLNNFINNLLDA